MHRSVAGRVVCRSEWDRGISRPRRLRKRKEHRILQRVRQPGRMWPAPDYEKKHLRCRMWQTLIKPQEQCAWQTLKTCMLKGVERLALEGTNP